MCNAPPYERQREYTEALSATRAASRRGRCTCPAIHDLIAHANEHVAEKRFSKEVGKIVYGPHVRNLDHIFLHLLTDEEMPAFNVLNALVMLGVVCEVDGRLIVARNGDGRIVVMEVKLLEEAFEVNGFLGRLGGSHDLGFTRRQGDCLLLFSQPQETAARQNRNTQPVVECLVAQSESVMPEIGFISPT